MIDKHYEKFKDRNDALKKLLDTIPSEIFKAKNAILLAISNGGIILSNEISRRTNIPFDFLLTQVIYSPKNAECEIAIVSENMDICIDEDLMKAFEISTDFIDGEAHRKYEEKILPDIYKLRKGQMISSLEKKNVFIIDDGVDSGLKMNVAIKGVFKKGASSVNIITPVISEDVKNIFNNRVDRIYSVYAPKHFVDTNHYYENLSQVSNIEIAKILENKINLKGD